MITSNELSGLMLYEQNLVLQIKTNNTALCFKKHQRAEVM